MGILAHLEGPDFVVIAVIVAVLFTPGVIAIAIVLLMNRRRNRPPPLPRSRDTSGATIPPKN
jgi:hypothetical protein